MLLVVGLQRLGYHVTEQERTEERKEVKVQIQIIRGPGRLDSRMTEMEREGRREDKVDTLKIGSPGNYGRL
jgi:tmRNA-binding protein